MARVYVPTSWRRFTGGTARLEHDAPDVRSLLAWLGTAYPQLTRELFDASGNLHRFVNVYVNDHGIDDLHGLETSLDREDEVAVIPAMAGGATATRSRFTPEQAVRYSRHIILPEIGGVGQRKLLNAKVVLIGAGGLGSPTALYLAAAGVGTLGIVDDDDVDVSNLQRQIIHTTDRIGTPKVDSAETTIHALNPDVNVVKYPVRLDASNILEIIDGYDVIVDGVDNFPTR